MIKLRCFGFENRISELVANENGTVNDLKLLVEQDKGYPLNQFDLILPRKNGAIRLLPSKRLSDY